jgi:hypothetical protein
MDGAASRDRYRTGDVRIFKTGDYDVVEVIVRARVEPYDRLPLPDPGGGRSPDSLDGDPGQPGSAWLEGHSDAVPGASNSADGAISASRA